MRISDGRIAKLEEYELHAFVLIPGLMARPSNYMVCADYAL